MICISGLRRLDGEFVPHGIPVVCIDRALENDLGFPHVGSDNIGGGYMATEHLIERGCKNILSISSFTANYPETNARWATSGRLPRMGCRCAATTSCLSRASSRASSSLKSS
ncbi:MAG: hypothetical protein ACLS89_01545 [Collinsella sp.]